MTPSTARPVDPASREFARTLAVALESLGLSLDTHRREKLIAHYRLLLDANRRLNLTRITAPADAAVKHYADSLAPLGWPQVPARPRCRVLDVGTGAGFPALPLAVARPDWHVTAIDGTAKKVRFVAACVERLGLANLEALHARCEELSADVGALDLICFRAVGELADCFRLARPLLADRGVIVCWKASRIAAAEWQAAGRAATRLGLYPPALWRYQIDGLTQRRCHQLATTLLRRS